MRTPRASSALRRCELKLTRSAEGEILPRLLRFLPRPPELLRPPMVDPPPARRSANHPAISPPAHHGGISQQIEPLRITHRFQVFDLAALDLPSAFAVAKRRNRARRPEQHRKLLHFSQQISTQRITPDHGVNPFLPIERRLLRNCPRHARYIGLKSFSRPRTVGSKAVCTARPKRFHHNCHTRSRFGGRHCST